jgi:hypothetical protein
MQQPDLLGIFISPLEVGNFQYFITGSIASTFYGEPRLTHDIDLEWKKVCQFNELVLIKF